MVFSDFCFKSEDNIDRNVCLIMFSRSKNVCIFYIRLENKQEPNHMRNW